MAQMTALIGSADALHSDGGELITLDQGFVLAPIGATAWDEIGAVLAAGPDAVNDLDLFLALLVKGAGVRAEGRFAYLEVDDLKQAAIVADGGAVISSYATEMAGSGARTPRGDWAANRALRQLGVHAAGSADECAALGLPR
jgi:hypothetical protein